MMQLENERKTVSFVSIILCFIKSFYISSKLGLENDQKIARQLLY